MKFLIFPHLQSKTLTPVLNLYLRNKILDSITSHNHKEDIYKSHHIVDMAVFGSIRRLKVITSWRAK